MSFGTGVEYGHPKAEQSAMPIDLADKVRDAITHLETKTGRVLEPNLALAHIDDGRSSEAAYCSGRPPMTLIVSSWSPPSSARGAIFGWT